MSLVITLHLLGAEAAQLHQDLRTAGLAPEVTTDWARTSIHLAARLAAGIKRAEGRAVHLTLRVELPEATAVRDWARGLLATMPPCTHRSRALGTLADNLAEKILMKGHLERPGVPRKSLA